MAVIEKLLEQHRVPYYEQRFKDEEVDEALKLMTDLCVLLDQKNEVTIWDYEKTLRKARELMDL